MVQKSAKNHGQKAACHVLEKVPEKSFVISKILSKISTKMAKNRRQKSAAKTRWSGQKDSSKNREKWRTLEKAIKTARSQKFSRRKKSGHSKMPG